MSNRRSVTVGADDRTCYERLRPTGAARIIQRYDLTMRSDAAIGASFIATALDRGLRKRCPHCGEGRLFSGWSFFECCSVCGLVFARNPGDTWAFAIVGDRLPIGAMVVLIYFGVVRTRPVLGGTLLLVFAVLAIWTAPNRWGVGIALHYLSRVYWPDPADPIPPPRV